MLRFGYSYSSYQEKQMQNYKNVNAHKQTLSNCAQI